MPEYKSVQATFVTFYDGSTPNEVPPMEYDHFSFRVENYLSFVGYTQKRKEKAPFDAQDILEFEECIQRRTRSSLRGKPSFRGASRSLDDDCGGKVGVSCSTRS